MPLEARGPVGLRVERGRGEGLQGSGVTLELWSQPEAFKEGQRGSETQGRLQVAAAPASWGARFPSDPLLLWLSVVHSHSKAGVRLGAVPSSREPWTRGL